jgi:MFS family permease
LVSAESEKVSARKTYFNLSVFEFLTFLRRGVFYTFMINYLFTLMGTVTSTAALGTLNMVASALGQNLLWGRICDKRKIRTTLIVAGETIAAFAYVIVFLVHTSLINIGTPYLAGLTIIFGLSILEFFWSMSDVGWAALLTDVTTAGNRGKVIGAMNFIASLGRMVGILFAGFLYAEGEGFRSGRIFYIVTALLLVGAGLMALTSRSMKKKQEASQRSKAEEPCVNSKEPKPDPQNQKTYAFFLMSLVMIILGAACINQIFLLFLNLPEGLNFGDSQMSLVLSAWTVGGMIASLTGGRLSDKFGRIKILLMGLCFAVVTPLFYPFASNVSLMATIYGLNGVSFWTIQTVGLVFAGDLIPKDRRGRLLGRYNTVIALSWGPAGFLIGGPLADLQVHLYGMSSYTAYVNVFYLSSIIVLAGTLLFVYRVARSMRK